jgi:hypothetical protein
MKSTIFFNNLILSDNIAFFHLLILGLHCYFIWVIFMMDKTLLLIKISNYMVYIDRYWFFY